MSETRIPRAPMSAQEICDAWEFTTSPYQTRRRKTRPVMVGNVGIGGTNPLRLQSMTISDTLDTESVVQEIDALWRAGSELVRVTAPNRTCAEHLGVIRKIMRKRGIDVPLVADIHFTPQAALIAAEHVEKVRINPGNYADRKHFKKWEYSDAEYDNELERLDKAFSPLVLRCRETGTAMRIGTNHGSLSDRILNRYGDTPLGMVQSAIEFVRICERHDYHDIVLSMKASDVKVMIQAYRLLAARMHQLGMDYPFHLGVTEAGSGLSARVKSAIGIGALLQDGIGDTVRVSLTEDSVHEIPVGREICAPFEEVFSAMPEMDLGTDGDRALPPGNPIQFQRREIHALGQGDTRLARDLAPRIELVVAVDDAAILADVLASEQQPDLILFDSDGTDTQLPALLQQCATLKNAPQAPAWGLQMPAQRAVASALVDQLLPGARLALRVSCADVTSLQQAAWRRRDVALQYTLEADVLSNLTELDGILNDIQQQRLPAAAVALAARGDRTLAQAWRHILSRHPKARFPVILQSPAEGAFRQHNSALHTAMALGALLVDGVGDALQLQASGAASTGPEYMREILQATRLRLSVADFIACPSCGRTQFDLQTTSAQIQTRFRHLDGLKIAIMGCIVNGPGEMADADFGYVGSGPGKIDLYVGHDRIERAIPEAQAVDRLEELIRAQGRWRAPAVRNQNGSIRVSS